MVEAQVSHNEALALETLQNSLQLQEQVHMEENQRYRSEIERLHKLLRDAMTDVRESKERSDTIILAQTQRIDEQSKMIEDMRKSPLRKLKGMFKRTKESQ